VSQRDENADRRAESPTRDEECHHGNRDPPGPAVSPCHEAYVERREVSPDACTIYSSVTPTAARDRWIRAWGDAFLSLEEMR